jgi:hypothetical protein
MNRQFIRLCNKSPAWPLPGARRRALRASNTGFSCKLKTVTLSVHLSILSLWVTVTVTAAEDGRMMTRVGCSSLIVHPSASVCEASGIQIQSGSAIAICSDHLKFKLYHHLCIAIALVSLSALRLLHSSCGMSVADAAPAASSSGSGAAGF